MNQIKTAIYQLAGEEFNLNSPKQLSAILYEKLGLKGKTASTSAEILEELVEEHPIVKEILAYRPWKNSAPLTWRLCPRRPSRFRPNSLHFQPICRSDGAPLLPRSELAEYSAPLQRSAPCFKPRSRDASFLGADYSQIELRLLAHFSQDKSSPAPSRPAEISTSTPLH